MQIRDGAAEAEADGEQRLHGAAVLAAQVGRARGDVRLQRLGFRHAHVLHELERVAAIVVRRRAREEIERDGIDPDLREAIGERLVVRVQAAHVGNDDHAGARRVAGPRFVRHEARGVGGRETQLAARRAARDRWNRRIGIVIDAHARLHSAPRRPAFRPRCP